MRIVFALLLLFGVTFDTANGTMYATQFIVNTPLQTLNLGTGLDTNNSGMTYDPVLNRFWDVDVNGRLSYFDPANGYAQTQVTTFPVTLDGLAFVTGGAPPPAPTVGIPVRSSLSLALLAVVLVGTGAFTRGAMPRGATRRLAHRDRWQW